VVVVVDPVWQGAAPRRFGGVEAAVGPPFGEGAVEPFDLAVGLRPVGAGALVCDAEFGAAVTP
jgi:hypothetical protein